jgi:hypothetical protein
MIVAVFGVAQATGIHSGLTPANVDEEVEAGDSVQVRKTVHTPTLPPKLDICLIVDLSGSYNNDLPNIKALAPGIFDAVKANVSDVQFGLASFVDYPFKPWGSPGTPIFNGTDFVELGIDYAYRLDQDLTPTKATWLAAVNAMATRSGVDLPESQYEALFQAATGAGRDVGDTGPSLGDIAPGQQCSFRPDATKVIILTTDASFHTQGDSNCNSNATTGCPFPYPGPTAAATTTALQNEGIKVIGLKAPGASGELDVLAAATGGSVQTTSSTSDDIADAILAGLAAIDIEVSMESNCATPISTTFTPPSVTVTSGEDAFFIETISAAGDAAPGTYACGDWALIDGAPMTDGSGALIVERKAIRVPDVTPPEADCVEAVNPSSKKVPTAPGNGGQGENQDGFYKLLAEDTFDPDPAIFVIDSETETTFGPFASGTKIKYTEANGAEPSIREMNGAVDWQIKGQGDAIVKAVDDEGNTAFDTCLVPPEPQ